MEEPIRIYKNQAELNNSLKEWQTKLFLNDWSIIAKIVDECSNDEYGTSGLNTHLPIQKTASIELLKDSCEIKLNGIFVSKQPQELILVHELLHCKFGIVCKDNETYENAVTEYYSHSLLEEIAKSLIMTKYNLKFDWFGKPYDNKEIKVIKKEISKEILNYKKRILKWLDTIKQYGFKDYSKEEAFFVVDVINKLKEKIELNEEMDKIKPISSIDEFCKECDEAYKNLKIPKK